MQLLSSAYHCPYTGHCSPYLRGQPTGISPAPNRHIGFLGRRSQLGSFRDECGPGLPHAILDIGNGIVSWCWLVRRWRKAWPSGQ